MKVEPWCWEFMKPSSSALTSPSAGDKGHRDASMAELPGRAPPLPLGLDSPEGLWDCRSKRAGGRLPCLPAPGAAGSSGPCGAASWPGMVGPGHPWSWASKAGRG